MSSRSTSPSFHIVGERLGPIEVVAHGQHDERRTGRREPVHERGREVVEVVGVVDHHDEVARPRLLVQRPIERRPHHVVHRVLRHVGASPGSRRCRNGPSGTAAIPGVALNHSVGAAGRRASPDDLVREAGLAHARGPAEPDAARARRLRLRRRGRAHDHGPRAASHSPTPANSTQPSASPTGANLGTRY